MLILMQGAPGSGKSTVGKRILGGLNRDRVGTVLVSTDDQHMVEGVYEFQPDRLAEFHQRTQDAAREWLAKGYTVIVDNCNILQDHTDVYLEMAKREIVATIRCSEQYENMHGVPGDVVLKMKRAIQWPRDGYMVEHIGGRFIVQSPDGLWVSNRSSISKLMAVFSL